MNEWIEECLSCEKVLLSLEKLKWAFTLWTLAGWYSSALPSFPLANFILFEWRGYSSRTTMSAVTVSL